MKKKERLVQYYDLQIRASSRDFPVPKTISVRRAFEMMEQVPFEQRRKSQLKNTELLYVAEWESDGQTVSILVNKSDTNISDPVFTVPHEGKRRTAAKEQGEGQDFSVHALFRLPKNEAEPALVLIEYSPGLGISVVQRLLNKILRDAKKVSPDDFKQNHPDGAMDDNGRPKKITATYKLEFNGHLSEELQDDLNKGKVQAIELIDDREHHKPFDEEGYIEEKYKSVVLKLSDENRPIKNRFEKIASLFHAKQKDYSRAKIKFKSPEGIDRTVEMNTAEGLSQAYVKRAKIDGFEGELKASYDSFDKQIIEKMRKLLATEP